MKNSHQNSNEKFRLKGFLQETVSEFLLYYVEREKLRDGFRKSHAAFLR